MNKWKYPKERDIGPISLLRTKGCFVARFETFLKWECVSKGDSGSDIELE